MATTIKNQKINTVLGKVTENSCCPLAKLKVEIYDPDMPELHWLDNVHKLYFGFEKMQLL